MHKDRALKENPIQILGILINLKMNCRIFLIFAVMEIFSEFMADFKKIWLTVSQRLVRAIKNKIKTIPPAIF